MAKGLHMVVNDVLETPIGIEYTNQLYREAFPDTGWNVKVSNVSDIRNIMSKKLKTYTDINGPFDLTLCLTTGGARFFYSHPIDNYSKRIAVLPYSTTHGCSLESTAESLMKELSKISNSKPKILILDGEVSVFGFTEKKMDNLKNAIGIWSKKMGKKTETKLGVGVLSRGYYDYKDGIVVRLKKESELRRSMDFYSVKDVDAVTRLSEDLVIMNEKNMGNDCSYFQELFDALKKRSHVTGTLPF